MICKHRVAVSACLARLSPARRSVRTTNFRQLSIGTTPPDSPACVPPPKDPRKIRGHVEWLQRCSTDAGRDEEGECMTTRKDDAYFRADGPEEKRNLVQARARDMDEDREDWVKEAQSHAFTDSEDGSDGMLEDEAASEDAMYRSVGKQSVPSEEQYGTYKKVKQSSSEVLASMDDELGGGLVEGIASKRMAEVESSMDDDFGGKFQ